MVLCVYINTKRSDRLGWDARRARVRALVLPKCTKGLSITRLTNKAGPRPASAACGSNEQAMASGIRSYALPRICMRLNGLPAQVKQEPGSQSAGPEWNRAR